MVRTQIYLTESEISALDSLAVQRGRKRSELIREAIKYIEDNVEKIAISTISIGKLCAGVKDDKEKKELVEFLELFKILPVTHEIAKLAGAYKQNFSKSHGIGLADALIAATAGVHHITLKTLNTKHFPMFNNLTPPYRKSK